MNKPLCIYHKDCADGFGAATVLYHAFGKDNIDFYGGVHNTEPPYHLARDRDLIFVDFCYKAPEMDMLYDVAKSILVIDHHVSAMESMKDSLGMDFRLEIDTHNKIFPGEFKRCWKTQIANLDEFFYYFDMDRSGAGLAWDLFVGGHRPIIIDHLEDRDLWRFKFPNTRAIQAAVFSNDYDFETWNKFLFVNRGSSEYQNMLVEGEALMRKHMKDVKELIRNAAYRMSIDGVDVPVLNCPYFYSSEAGNIMAVDEPFAACYWDTPDGRLFSLRSEKQGHDVSKVAEAFGGGGHKNASGFKIAWGDQIQYDVRLNRMTSISS